LGNRRVKPLSSGARALDEKASTRRTGRAQTGLAACVAIASAHGLAATQNGHGAIKAWSERRLTRTDKARDVMTAKAG